MEVFEEMQQRMQDLEKKLAQNAKDLSHLKSKDCKDVFDSDFNITGLCGINVGGEIKQVFVTWTQVEGNGWYFNEGLTEAKSFMETGVLTPTDFGANPADFGLIISILNFLQNITISKDRYHNPESLLSLESLHQITSRRYYE
ncbi:uncharacterized protein LOC143452534 isoform X1 [Clavelina lepadiformis]|uniref:uncharacterized protein LOC143452534 isoform X1 n=1 Tax=Clavelina lepadiformis TaxID=159417 RepID=UPI004041626F